MLPRGLRAGRQRQSARQARRFPRRRRARAAAGRRGARPTRWTRSSIRRGTTCATRRPTRRRDGRRAQRVLDADGPVHRRHRARDPAPALRALLDQGDARLGHGRVRRAVHAPADAGHGARTTLSSAATTRAASTTSRPPTSTIVRDDAGPRSPAARSKADGQPVEYGGLGTMSKSQAERRRSAGHDRPLRRRRRAAVRDVRGPPEADARMVGHRRRGRAPFPASGCGPSRRRTRDARARRRAGAFDWRRRGATPSRPRGARST